MRNSPEYFFLITLKPSLNSPKIKYHEYCRQEFVGGRIILLVNLHVLIHVTLSNSVHRSVSIDNIPVLTGGGRLTGLRRARCCRDVPL